MIFLDNASTTKMYEEAFKELKKYYIDEYYNPSAIYSVGIKVHKELELARQKIANLLGCQSDNIIFTSSATEASNLALFGSIQSNFKHIVTVQTEHPSTYNSFKELQNKGIKVDYLNVNTDGTVNINSLKQIVNKDTNLISIMMVNNETGAINNIKEIVNIVKNINPSIIVICDCVQAFCKLNFKVKQLGVDFAIISSHKVHGPKGVGALYCKNFSKLKPIILGGGQEKGLRSGTENSGGIIAFAKASEIMYSKLDNNFKHISKLKNICINKFSELDNVIINSKENSSPYILSLSIKGIKAEVLLHMLEEYEIFIGNGSACSSKHQDNRVLKSMKVAPEYIQGTIRISFSEFNTENEVVYACDKIIECINKLRKIIEKR